MLIHGLTIRIPHHITVLQCCNKFDKPNDLVMPRRKRDNCNDVKYPAMYEYFKQCRKEIPEEFITEVRKKFLYQKVADKFYYASWRSVEAIILKQESDECKGDNRGERGKEEKTLSEV